MPAVGIAVSAIEQRIVHCRNRLVGFRVVSLKISRAVRPCPIGIHAHSAARLAFNIKVMLLDQAVDLNVNEIDPRRRAPMAQETRLDVFRFQRLPQKRIVVKIDGVRCLNRGVMLHSCDDWSNSGTRLFQDIERRRMSKDD